MNTNSTRLAGHELRSEGAAYKPGERRGTHLRVHPGWSVSGYGYGLCACGAKSGELSSGSQRKAWHRLHKNTIAGRTA